MAKKRKAFRKPMKKQQAPPEQQAAAAGGADDGSAMMAQATAGDAGAAPSGAPMSDEARMKTRYGAG